MVHNKVKQLICLLQGELYVDIPLFYNNRHNAVRLDLMEIDDLKARQIVKSVLQFLFGKHLFWLCAYGCDSGDIVNNNRLLHSQSEVTVVPYHSSVDRDWFEYDHDAIACAEISLKTLAIDNYLDYVFRLEFLSNTLFLVNVESKVAVHVYDRRGMDVAATDPLLLENFKQQFIQYLQM